MGYNGEHAEPLVIDIETTAREGIEDLLDAPSAPANYKDPEKIAAAKAEKRLAQVSNAALNFYLNRITAIGIWTPSTGFQVVIAKDLAEERAAIAALAVIISNNGHRRRVIGFNSLSFDLPNLIVRARSQRLRFPVYLSDITPKYKHAANDVMEVMTLGGLCAKQSLDFYCRVEGIDSDEPDDIKALHGKDMPMLAVEGQWDLIAGHCRHDLKRTVQLAQFAEVITDVEHTDADTDRAPEPVALF